MMAIFKSLSTMVILVSLLALVQCSSVFAQSHGMRKDELQVQQLETAKRHTIANLIKAQQIPKPQQYDTSTLTSGNKNITFSNPLASREFKFMYTN
jgi:Tfp pilus assembly protein PilP